MQLNPSRWLTNVKIGRRLMFSFGLVVLAVALTTGYMIFYFNRAEQSTNAYLENKMRKLELTEIMTDAVSTVNTNLVSLMLLKESPDEQAKLYKEIADVRKDYDEAWNELASMSHSQEGAELVGRLEEARSKARPANDQVIALAQKGKMDEAQSLLIGTAKELTDTWYDLLTDYSELQRKQADASVKEVTEAARVTNLTAMSMLGVLVVVSLAISIAITRSITRPLNTLQNAIHAVRGGGSMEALAAVNTRDEFNDMGFAVNQMLQEQISMREKAEEEHRLAEENRRKAQAENESLNNSVISVLEALDTLAHRDLTIHAPVSKDIVGTVSDSVNQLVDETSKVLHGVSEIAGQVAEGSNKVRSQGERVSVTAADERASVTEMVNSLGEATSSINRVAALAEQSNHSAELATGVTNTALATVNDTVHGMESIRETIAETEKRIKRLGERSQEISGIVNLINSISERTHVLALNASMQAAVAGDAGRGFAVVAEEVQRLAESSRNATQQIATLVSNIQVETNETISTVNRTIGQVVQGSEQAQKAGEQMRETQKITQELVDQVRRISEASSEQKEVSVHLLEAVQHLGQSNEQTMQQIDAQAQETKNLQESARKLVESVSVFKLPHFA